MRNIPSLLRWDKKNKNKNKNIKPLLSFRIQTLPISAEKPMAMLATIEYSPAVLPWMVIGAWETADPNAKPIVISFPQCLARL
jgi:hypothetical protein